MCEVHHIRCDTAESLGKCFLHVLCHVLNAEGVEVFPHQVNYPPVSHHLCVGS